MLYVKLRILTNVMLIEYSYNVRENVIKISVFPTGYMHLIGLTVHDLLQDMTISILKRKQELKAVEVENPLIENKYPMESCPQELDSKT